MDNQPQNRQIPNQNTGEPYPSGPQNPQSGFQPTIPPPPSQSCNPAPQQYQQKQPNKFFEFLKKHKLIFIIGAAMVGVAIVTITVIIPMLNHNGDSYVAKAGETLKIEGKMNKFELSVKSPLEKYSNNKGDFLRMKVSVKNLSAEKMSFALSPFFLVDSSKNVVYENISTISVAFLNLENPLIEPESGMTEEGYLYFYSTEEETKDYTYKYITNYQDMDKVAYLGHFELVETFYNEDGKLDAKYDEFYLPTK